MRALGRAPSGGLCQGACPNFTLPRSPAPRLPVRSELFRARASFTLSHRASYGRPAACTSARNGSSLPEAPAPFLLFERVQSGDSRFCGREFSDNLLDGDRVLLGRIDVDSVQAPRPEAEKLAVPPWLLLPVGPPPPQAAVTVSRNSSVGALQECLWLSFANDARNLSPGRDRAIVRCLAAHRHWSDWDQWSPTDVRALLKPCKPIVPMTYYWPGISSLQSPVTR